MYKHPKTNTMIKGFNSHKEHTFFEKTTKRQLFLLAEQMAERLKDEDKDWIDFVKNEIELLKINGIK